MPSNHKLNINFPKTDKTIYQSENLVAVFSPAAQQSTTVVVTFYPFYPPEKIKPAMTGCSRETLRKFGLDCIHVMPKGNHWYQYDDLEHLLAVIKDYCRDRYEKLTTYGQSMGAYAALHCSASLAADRVVAISPQFTTDKNKVDFDPGWQFYINKEKIHFIRDDFDKNINASAEIIIAYDPFYSPDIEHAREIRKRVQVTPLVMPFCAHSIGECLYDAGLIPGVLFDLLAGDGDTATIRVGFRKKRYTISRYAYRKYMTLIDKAIASGNFAQASDLANKARMEFPRNLELAKKYCEIAEKQEAWQEASSRWLECIARFGDEATAYSYIRCILSLRKINDQETAEIISLKAKQSYPDNMLVLKEHAENASIRLDFKLAKERWLTVIDKLEDKSPALAFLRIYQAAVKLDEPELAKAYIDRGAALYPNSQLIIEKNRAANQDHAGRNVSKLTA